MDENCLNKGSSLCHDFDCDEECPGRIISDRVKADQAEGKSIGDFEVALEEVLIKKRELRQAVARAESMAVVLIDDREKEIIRLTIAHGDAAECYRLMAEGRDNLLKKIEELQMKIGKGTIISCEKKGCNFNTEGNCIKNELKLKEWPSDTHNENLYCEQYEGD